MRNLRWRKILFALFVFMICFFLWFLPSIVLSHGWGPYMAAVRLQSKGIWNQGIVVNLCKIGAYSLWGLGASCLLLPLFIKRLPLLKLEGLFFVLWIFPYILLTTFVGFGQPGMLLVIAPPLILLISRNVSACLFELGTEMGIGRLAYRRVRLGMALIICVLLCNVFLFSKAPFLSAKGFLEDDASFLDKVNTEFFLISGKGIKFTDEYYSELFAFIHREFNPSETLIFTNFKAWSYARYYLRSYPIHNYFCFYGLKNGKANYIPEGEFSIPPGVRYIVLFNGDKHSINFQDTLGPYNLSREITKTSRVYGDVELQFLDVSGKRTVSFRPNGFSVS